jgi:polysaccharide export outer membrane protein
MVPSFSSSSWLQQLPSLLLCLYLGCLNVGTSALALAQAADGGIRTPASALPGESAVLDVGDEITLSELDVEEFNNRSFQVATDGSIGLPLVGRIQSAGLTVSDFERSLDEKLRRYIKDPHATITAIKYHGRSVSLVGAVNNPGAYQITEPRTLLEMLSLAGGLKSDAGSWLLLTRKDEDGKLPLHPNVTFSAGVSEARIPIAPLLAGTDPSLNLIVRPKDVIMVAKAEMVYAVGEVRKQGGFVMGEHEQLSLIKLLSLAEGLQSTAAPALARVIRESGDTRTETPVDVQKILQGKASDILLRPDDILFVPTNTPKKFALRAIEAAIQTGTGLAIYRR